MDDSFKRARIEKFIRELPTFDGQTSDTSSESSDGAVQIPPWLDRGSDTGTQDSTKRVYMKDYSDEESSTTETSDDDDDSGNRESESSQESEEEEAGVQITNPPAQDTVGNAFDSNGSTKADEAARVGISSASLFSDTSSSPTSSDDSTEIVKISERGRQDESAAIPASNPHADVPPEHDNRGNLSSQSSSSISDDSDEVDFSGKPPATIDHQAEPVAFSKEPDEESISVDNDALSESSLDEPGCGNLNESDIDDMYARYDLSDMTRKEFKAFTKIARQGERLQDDASEDSIEGENEEVMGQVTDKFVDNSNSSMTGLNDSDSGSSAEDHESASGSGSDEHCDEESLSNSNEERFFSQFDSKGLSMKELKKWNGLASPVSKLERAVLHHDFVDDLEGALKEVEELSHQSVFPLLGVITQRGKDISTLIKDLTRFTQIHPLIKSVVKGEPFNRSSRRDFEQHVIIYLRDYGLTSTETRNVLPWVKRHVEAQARKRRHPPAPPTQDDSEWEGEKNDLEGFGSQMLDHLEVEHKRAKRKRERSRKKTRKQAMRAKQPNGEEAPQQGAERGFNSSKDDDKSVPKGLEPESQAEAHTNYIRSNERDPRMPEEPNDTPGQRRAKEQHSAEFIKHLRDTREFANKKQVECYEHGGMPGLDRGAKQELESLKDERDYKEGVIADNKRKREKADHGQADASMKRRKSQKSTSLPYDASATTPPSAPSPTTEHSTIDTPATRTRSKTQCAPSTPSSLPDQVTHATTATKATASTTKQRPKSDSVPPPRRKGVKSKIKKGSDLGNHLQICSEPTKRKRTRSSTKSPYFAATKAASSKPKAVKKNVSCIPFPALSAQKFGLAQERLRDNPFQLLIACVFLTKTRGAVSMPVFYKLIAKYPDARTLAEANRNDVVEIFAHLGLQNQRADRIIKMAGAYRDKPPQKGARYRSLHYPCRGDGKDLTPDECIDSDDERVGWETAHIPGVGPYGFDSWRIFCRDSLRGREDASELDKEWTRVLPLDKELRAYLRWRWMRNGWVWDPITGNKRKAEEFEMEKAEAGGVMIEDDGGGKIAAVERASDAQEPVQAKVSEIEKDEEYVNQELVAVEV